MKQVTITHLYPKEMNIYGDMGNIITLKQRLLARGYDVVYDTIGLSDKQFKPADIYFMGGGQDNDMYKVFDDLLTNKKEFIEKEVAQGKVFLLICGAFQLFGRFFLDSSGRRIKGLGILPIETKAPGDQLTDRCLGNLLSVIEPDIAREVKIAYGNSLPSNTLVGFENHSGQTYFMDDTIKPLARVLVGKGNNNTDEIDGAKLGNIFGSYSHGSLLPKNPHLADYLIFLALKNKYGNDFAFPELDDNVEWLAHTTMRDRLLK
jgi:CobQ-like glutamine amidotransferase family enzyme